VKSIADVEKSVANVDAAIVAQNAKTETLVDMDLAEFQKQLEDVDSTNAKVRQNDKRHEVATNLSEATIRYEELSDEINDIDAQIKEMYEMAHWPIPGLGFDAEGVTYQTFPFAQCSSAEQLRVSVSMGFAANPSLKLLLIRDGSLLDENSLAQVAALAAEHGGQVFLERVGEGSETNIILKDGEIVGQEVEEPEAVAEMPVKTLFDDVDTDTEQEEEDDVATDE
jgi:uncharacterized protein YeeX (DUF496 family)